MNRAIEHLRLMEGAAVNQEEVRLFQEARYLAQFGTAVRDMLLSGQGITLLTLEDAARDSGLFLPDHRTPAPAPPAEGEMG